MENRKKTLETILVLVAALLLFYLWKSNVWVLRGTLLLAAIGIFWPWLAAQIHAGWMLLAKGLGWLNGKILLSALFFLILTPVAFVARMFGKANLQLSRKKDGSYYTVREHKYEAKDLENMF